jgi:L-threonylcarbamoyladenylate synthase
MLTKHYAPKTATYLTENVADLISSFNEKKMGVLLLDGKLDLDNQITKIVLSEKGDLAEAAKNLYESLHQLDKMNLDVIIAQKMPEVGLGVSINDRLERATKK